MLKPDKIRKALRDLVDEGKIKFELAPLEQLPKGLPHEWEKILTSEDPVKSVLEQLWFPQRDLLPKTIAQLKKKLRFVGLLQTKEIPWSLVYVFDSEGDPTFSRGYPCRSIKRPEAKKLPARFLNLYKIHNGWTGVADQLGFISSEGWFNLGTIYGTEYDDIIPHVRLKDFLVICDTGGSGYLGFNLSKHPPAGLVCSDEDPVKAVRDVVRTLDVWMAEQLDELT